MSLFVNPWRVVTLNVLPISDRIFFLPSSHNAFVFPVELLVGVLRDGVVIDVDAGGRHAGRGAR